MTTEILNSYPVEEIFTNYEPRFRPVFATAEKLLKNYYESPEKLLTAPDDFFIDDLLTQARDLHAAGQGYIRDYHDATNAGDKRIARESLGLAVKTQSLALILADAADRANQAEGKKPNRLVHPKVEFIWRRAMESPADTASVEEFVRLFDVERQRGFRIVSALQPLVMVIGDEGCPDTTNILRITNAFRLPVHLLVINQRHNRRDGFRRSNDHAQAYHEDAFLNERGEKAPPPIPQVAFPIRDGGRHELQEPSLFEFFKCLVDWEMI